MAEVDSQLEAICLKALERDRHARYATAATLSEDVQRWMAGEPVLALPEPAYRRFHRWVAVHRRLSHALVLGGVLLGAVLATQWATAHQRRVVAGQVRQQQIVDETSETAARVEAEVEELARNARFLASLPPIQGLISARLKQV